MAVTWKVSQLENGLRVVTTPVPTAQSVSVCIFAGVGSRMEERRTNGLSHYLEHMLFKGSASRPTALSISQAIEGAGGVLNAFTSKEFTSYWAQVPYDRLELALDVLADMVSHPLLDTEEIERERSVVQQEIRRAHDHPGAWTSELLSRACYGDQPLGWAVSGTEESVQGLQRQDFLDHVRRWYVPDNMVVSVAGNTEHDQVVSLVQDRTESTERRNVPPFLPAKQGLPQERVQVEGRDIDQSNLALGLRALSRRDPDRFILTVLNSVLGRGMSSRLFKEVRERRGLAYSVGSAVTRHHDTGLLTVAAGVSPQKLDEATKVILEEIFGMAAEPVPEEEMTRARDYTVGNFRLSLETTMALAQRAGESLLTLGEIEEVDDIVAKLQAATAADVQRVAQRFLDRNNVAMALVGPQAQPDLLEKALAG